MAAGVAGVVALATPYGDWLTPVVATWLATIPLLIAVAGLRVWLVRLLRRDAPDSVARDDANQAEVEA